MKQFSNTIEIMPGAGKGKRVGFPYSKELFPYLIFDQYRSIFMNIFDSTTKIVNEIVIIMDE